jgi:cell division protein FtsW
MQQIFKKIQGDKVIWMITFLLSILSILAVYSAISTLAYKAEGNSLRFLFKHMFMIVVGFGVMFVVHKVRFKYFSRLAPFMLGVAAVVLLLTLLFGPDINQAKRWLRIPGLGLTVQTSDFAKIVLVTFVARQLNQNRTKLHDFWKGVWPILLPVLMICGLILIADFSTAAMLFAVCFLMFYLGGVPVKHLLRITGVGIAGLAIIFMVGKTAPDLIPRLDTWISRIESFTQPDDDSGNYQTNFAQVAIYKGGFIPSGPGSSTARNYLPHPYSDMIYAFVIEEYGSIFGGLGLLLLYLILLYRSIRIALKSPKHFGGLLALGLSFMLVTQAIINMAVAVRLFPTTGQPLPLVSMGGTSMVFTCLAIGMILSVSRSVFNAEEWKSDNEETETGNRNVYAAG